MDKLFKNLNSVNNFSRNIIFYGCIIVLALCLIGACIIGYNSLVIQEVALYSIGSNIMRASVVVFAQVIIGALIMDWFNRMN